VGADAFFREVNDRIMELGDRFGFRADQLELICECEDACCTDRVGISAADFAALRGKVGLHLIADGHAHAGRVVGRGDGYLVVTD
jgi:hypothetical protein